MKTHDWLKTIRLPTFFVVTWLALVAGAVFLHPVHAQQSGVFAGGQKFVVLTTASTNSQLIGIPGPHQLLEVTTINSVATQMGVKLYDASSAPTCSAPPIAYYIVAGAVAPATGTVPINLAPLGATFQNGIGICIVAVGVPPTLADTGNAVAGLVLNLTIK